MLNTNCVRMPVRCTLRRIQKELLRYEEELERQRAKVARMRLEGADEYDVRKQASSVAA